MAVGDPSGYYGTLADCYAIAGESNFIGYSNLEGGTTIDLPRVQSAMAEADAKVNAYLRRYVSVPVAIGDGYFKLLTDAWAYFVTTALYRSRGERDLTPEGTPNYAKSGTWEKEAYSLLKQYVDATLDQPLPGSFVNVKLRFEPACLPQDEYSS